MTGRFDLNLGEHYAFDPRRAKEVAEGRDQLADSTVINGDAVPVTGVNSGEAFDMTWFADGVPITVTHTATGVETKLEVLQALAALGQADASVATGLGTTTVVLLVTAGPELAAGSIERNGGAGGGSILQPGDMDGPTQSPHGAPYWIKRSGGQGSIWYAGWDIDSDPEPDVWVKMQDLRNGELEEPYVLDIEAHARGLGWPG